MHNTASPSLRQTLLQTSRLFDLLLTAPPLSHQGTMTEPDPTLLQREQFLVSLQRQQSQAAELCYQEQLQRLRQEYQAKLALKDIHCRDLLDKARQQFQRQLATREKEHQRELENTRQEFARAKRRRKSAGSGSGMVAVQFECGRQDSLESLTKPRGSVRRTADSDSETVVRPSESIVRLRLLMRRLAQTPPSRILVESAKRKDSGIVIEELQAQNHSLRLQIGQYRGQCLELEFELKMAGERERGLRRAVAQAEAKAQECKESQMTCLRTIQQMKGRQLSARMEHSRLVEQLEDKEEQIQELQEQLALAQEREEGAEARLAAIELQVREMVAAHTQSRQELTRRLKERQTELDEARAESQKLRGTHAREMAEERAGRVRLRERQQRLQEDVDNLRARE